MHYSIRERLLSIGQKKLAEQVSGWDAAALEQFSLQLDQYEKACKEQHFRHFEPLSPCLDAVHARDVHGAAIGKVGCIVLAGGQGTRLGVKGPKGAVPVTPISHKSLFEVLSEKVRAVDLPVAIMTSSANHEETVAFFQKHGNFGLSALSFFQQEDLPLLDEDGEWFCEQPGVLACASDGNGHALARFYASGLWGEWKECGIEYVTVVFVDNPLAPIFNADLIGFCKNKDAVLLAVERLSPTESMGVVAQTPAGIRVIEYTELPSDPSAYRLSSTGMFCVSMPFIERLSRVTFPLHVAYKEVAGRRVGKCERFLFDLLLFTSSSAALVFPREEVYAPLKNRQGDRSVTTVQRSLFDYYRTLYKRLTGKAPVVEHFELSMEFEYASQEVASALASYPLAENECLTVDKVISL